MSRFFLIDFLEMFNVIYLMPVHFMDQVILSVKSASCNIYKLKVIGIFNDSII